MSALWFDIQTLFISHTRLMLLISFAAGLLAVIFSLFCAWLVLRYKLKHEYALYSARLDEAVSVERQAKERVNWQYEQLSDDFVRVSDEMHDLRSRERQLTIELSEERTRAEEKRCALEAELGRLTALRETLAQEFEVLVLQLIQNQQKHFAHNSEEKMQSMLLPLQRQLSDFRKRVDEVHSSDIAQTHQLLGQIKQLQTQSQKIGDDAVKLTNALKGNNKLMGNWGEWVLQRVLESSGLVEGRDFVVQPSIRDSSGQRLQPDIVLHLPQQKNVVIDSKVSLLAYENLVNSGGDDKRQVYEKDLVNSIRQHVKDLASKRYEHLPGIHSPDFVVMFIPIESALSLALQLSPNVLGEAYTKGVILAAPTSLMAILRIVESAWHQEKQDKNIELILQEAGKMHDQFVRFLDSMTEIGTSLERALRSHELAMGRLSDNKGNLIKRVQNLQALGAKTQKVFESTDQKVSGAK